MTTLTARFAKELAVIATIAIMAGICVGFLIVNLILIDSLKWLWGM